MSRLLDGIEVDATEYEQLVTQRNELVQALRDLLEQIDCLDDISYSRDTEPYKAEANWQDTYDRACAVLKEATS